MKTKLSMSKTNLNEAYFLRQQILLLDFHKKL